MTTSNTPGEPQAQPPAPFDPRRAQRDDRTPPPRPPSTWLEPIAEYPDAPEDEPEPFEPPPVVEDDDVVVLEDDPQPAEHDHIDPQTQASPVTAGRRTGTPNRVRRLATPAEVAQRGATYTPQQRLLILDTWQRSGLPAGDYAPLVGVSKHTLYAWKAKFEADGPAGLCERKRGRESGSRLPDVVKRAILLMKEHNPDWGIERISDVLMRSDGFAASANAVARVLKEAGCEPVSVPTRPHKDHVRSFERARPNQLWQTDLFTFMLKRQNQRVYLVAFLDDHSRYVVSYALHASQSGSMVIEALRAGIASYGAPEEVLTDNGSQYVTWRGTSAFQHECRKRGIRQIVATPRHPQTLGKTERFWGTLWRECAEAAVFTDLGDARIRIGHFIDYYNFQRPHQGIGGLAPADRFFGAAPTMLSTLKERVAANAVEIARHGAPKTPFYLAGNVNGQSVSVHSAGDRLLMKTGTGQPVEVSLAGGAPPAQPLPEPVAAHGVPSSPWEGAPRTPPPGISAVDALFTDPLLVTGDAPVTGGAP